MGTYVISSLKFMIQYSDTCGASLVAQTVKILPALQVTQVQSLGWEDSLAKRMATHSNILAWENL